MDPGSNPFAVLSLIVAPALLTNASSVLSMSTSNRLARAADRARELSRQLEESSDLSSFDNARRLRELMIAERRTMMLIQALRSFYVALGGFASATFVSLVGAVLVPVGAGAFVTIPEMLGIAAGLVAVGAIVNGSVILLRETRLAVQAIRERAANVRARAAAGPDKAN